MAEPVVVGRGLVRSFGGKESAVTAALRGVDIDVGAGEWLAIMGPSGCGKSTLLQLLGGLDRPDAGSVTLAGRRLDGAGETELARIRRSCVGFVFQQYNLLSQLDVSGNVMLPLRLTGVDRHEARRRCDDLLDQLGLSERAHAHPATLSGGEQQRVALARAVAHAPAVLLADEPTGALDSAAARTVLEVLEAQHRSGQTIVMVTHDPAVAAAADRLVRMRDGRIDDPEPPAGAS